MSLVVNGKTVDDSVLDAEFSNIKSYFERLGNVSCCERDPEFRGYARQNIIGRILLEEEALRRFPVISEAEVDAAFDKLKEENGGEVRFLASIGATTEQLPLVKRDLETNLKVQKLMDELVQDESAPADEEMRDYYQKNIALFMNPEQVRASHISKAPPRGEMRHSAYDEMRQVRQKLLSGEDFDELARAHSDRGQELIDLGFFQRGEVQEEFELVAFSMKVGEISPVFGSMVGYHIIKLTDQKPAAAKPFDDVRDEIRERILQERRQIKTQALVDELKKSAVIEGDEEDLAAASPHEHGSNDSAA